MHALHALANWIFFCATPFGVVGIMGNSIELPEWDAYSIQEGKLGILNIECRILNIENNSWIFGIYTSAVLVCKKMQTDPLSITESKHVCLRKPAKLQYNMTS